MVDFSTTQEAAAKARTKKKLKDSPSMCQTVRETHPGDTLHIACVALDFFPSLLSDAWYSYIHLQCGWFSFVPKIYVARTYAYIPAEATG